MMDMELTRKPIATTAVSAVLVAALTACGGGEDAEALASDAPAVTDEVDETAYGFDDIDMDGDSELDADEFHEWTEGSVVAFYIESDLIEDPAAPEQIGPLDEVVFIDALYSAWDVNDDEALDRAEWDAATRVIESISGTEAAWIEFDVDANEVIAIDEVQAQLEDDDVLAGIDADNDGLIQDQELNDWFFTVFDVNEDGVVSMDEWRLAETYFGVPVL